MTTKRYDIGGFFNKLRDSEIGDAQSTNMYLTIDPITQKKAIVIASGHEFKKTINASNAWRAAIVLEKKGLAFIVVGNEFIQLDTTLAETVLGTITTTDGYVGITATDNEVVLCDGTAMWRFDTNTTTFSEVFFGGPPFPQASPGITPKFTPIDVVNVNGFLVAIDGSSTDWRISLPNNARDWRTLDVVIAPFSLVGVGTINKRLFVFGNSITQVWNNQTGATGFAFSEDESVLIEHGIASVGTALEAFQLMFYVSSDEDGISGVQMIAGTLPQKISTPAIDLALSKLTDVTAASAILYKELGLIFYQINFTADNKTFVYVMPDVQPRTLGSWHELQTYDGKRHIAQVHFYFTNKHFIGSYLNQDLFELSHLFRKYGVAPPAVAGSELIKCILVGLLIENEGHKRIRLDRFEIEMVTGLSDVPVLTTAEEPQIFLSLSRDGGKTFGNVMNRPVGSSADSAQRVIFRRLGVLRGRDLIPKIEFHYEVPLFILGIILTFEDLPQ